MESLLLLSVLFDTTVDELIKGDVETMKNCVENDYKKMVQLSWGGLGLAILGCALLIAGLTFWNWDIVPSVIIWLLVWGIGMALIMKCERIKKEHDLVTYQEILAFKKGEPIDRSNRKSRRARQHRGVKGIAITLVAAAVGGALGYFSAMHLL